MGSYKIGRRELKSLGIPAPVPDSPPRGDKQLAAARKGKEAARDRRAKKLAKRRAGKAAAAAAAATMVSAGDSDDDVEEGEGGAPEATAEDNGDSPEPAADANDGPDPMAEDALEEGDPEQTPVEEQDDDDDDDDDDDLNDGDLDDYGMIDDYLDDDYYDDDEDNSGDVEDQDREDAARDGQRESSKDKTQLASEAKAETVESSQPTPEESTLRPPATLRKLNLSVARWKQLEETSRAMVPRFLYRFFNSVSGGGFKGLNGPDGVTPLAFLQQRDKKPTNIYDIHKVKRMIRGHLGGAQNIVTEFSSWAADFSWTMHVIAGFGRDTYVAIIDTTLLASHVRIYHTHDLKMAGLSDQEYSEEYLIYGPISGPAYHCIKLTDISKEDFDTISMFASPRSLRKGGLHVKAPGPITVEDIVAAKNIATLLRRPDDKRPDAIIAVTAAALCVRDRPGEFRVLSDSDWGLLQAHLADELKSLRLPTAAASSGLGLANPNTYTKSHPKLQQTVNLLMAIEARLRASRESASRQLKTPPPDGGSGNSPKA